MKKYSMKYFRFTLVELIVSMSVFALLAMVVVQLFASTQKLWANAEGKNETFRDTRMALDLMVDLLQNVSHATTAEQGTQFFRLKNSGVTDSESENSSFTKFSKLYFATKSSNAALPQSDTYKNPIRFVTFQVVNIDDKKDPDYNRNVLVMRIVSDGNGNENFDDFVNFFPNNSDENRKLVDNEFNADKSSSLMTTDPKKLADDEIAYVTRLLNNVVAFRVRFGDRNMDLYKTPSGTEYSSTGEADSNGKALFPYTDTLPAVVEITIQTMPRKHYETYMMRFADNDFDSQEAQEFRQQYAHTFRRYVHFGQNRGSEF